MTLILAVETTGSSCSVAVARDGAILAAECQAMRYGHAEALLPMVDRVTAAAGMTPRLLDCVAAAVGPGGFTGIRAGLAAAQGIARAAGARLVGVTSFAAVAVPMAMAKGGLDPPLLVALDSRREDLYVQLFGDAALPLSEPHAVMPAALADHVASILGNRQGRLLIAGDAAIAAAAALGSRDADVLAGDNVPDARGVAAAAWRQLRPEGPHAPLRPLYLRPPDVTQPLSAVAGPPSR